MVMVVFTGMVALGVGKVRSVFPRFRDSIWKRCRKRVHQTVARAEFRQKSAKTKQRGRVQNGTEQSVRGPKKADLHQTRQAVLFQQAWPRRPEVGPLQMVT